MKKLILLAILFSIISCQQNKKDDQQTVNDKIVKEKQTSSENKVDTNAIQVLYFHSSIRCTTCVSVDENTKKYLSELFPDKMKKRKIVYKSLNIDKDERKDLIQKFEIYGQRLLFIKGDKVLDKTDEAFQYVTSQPEKWRNIVKKSIETLN